MSYKNLCVRFNSKEVEDRLKSLAQEGNTTPNMLINMLVLQCDREKVKTWDYKALDKRRKKSVK